MAEQHQQKLQDLPEAIRPIYTTPNPNDRVLLYEGDIEVHQSNQRQYIQRRGCTSEDPKYQSKRRCISQKCGFWEQTCVYRNISQTSL